MFNLRLKNVRIKNKITQQVMADKIGVTLRAYQHYEAGSREPSINLIVVIADVLNVSVDFLFGRDDYLKSLGVSFEEYQ